MPSTNETEFYGLSQWVDTDPFVRVDFNADNAKVDEALHRVEALTQSHEALLPYIGHDLYNLILQNYYEGKESYFRQAMLFEGLRNQGLIATITGPMQVGSTGLVLTGAGTTGTMTAINLAVYVNWTRARAWVRYSGGSLTLSVNGTAGRFSGRNTAKTPEGVSCREDQFDVVGTGLKYAEVALGVSSGTNPSVTVYDYGIIFL